MCYAWVPQRDDWDYVGNGFCTIGGKNYIHSREIIHFDAKTFDAIIEKSINFGYVAARGNDANFVKHFRMDSMSLSNIFCLFNLSLCQ